MNKIQENKIREKFLEKFKCTNSDCDGKGNIPHQIGEDDWETEQCQICFEYRFGIADFFLSRFREMEGEVIINSARQLGKTRTTCIKLTGIDIDEGEKECQHNEWIDCPSRICTSDLHNQHCKNCSKHRQFFHPKEVRSKCCAFCHKIPDDGKCYNKECACHTHPYSKEVSQCCKRESTMDSYEGLLCSGCSKSFIPSQEKECTHPYIENNMIPDTCRDCGKVLQDNDNKEPWWDKDFDEKYKISGNTFSIDTVHELNEADANELKSLIRSVEERAREEVLQKIKNIPTHNIKDRGDRHWLLREDVYQALDELK